MIIRNSVAAGSFYPFNSEELKSMIEKFYRMANVDKKDVVGAVVPHAGYIYCGLTQAHVYKSIMQGTSFIILGPNHMRLGYKASIMTQGIWKTPLGITRIDSELANAILNESEVLKEDLSAHSQEHSVEVQLPWIKQRFAGASFVPISISRLEREEMKDIGQAIRKAQEKTKIKSVVIASSDFTHFGDVYGYTPVTGGLSKILGFIKKIDTEAAQAICDLAPERFLDIIKEYNATICGAHSIATMLYAIKDKARKGKVLHSSNSYQVSQNQNAIVDYFGIIIE